MNVASIRKNVHRTDGKVPRVPASMAATEERTETMTITPEIAKKWLGQNTSSNRKVNPGRVQAYASEMRAGRWQLTHQGIAFNQSGELVDGQHRLHAVVMSLTAIRCKVTTGLPIEYNSPIDQTFNRTLPHLTGMSSRRVSVARGLVALEDGLENVNRTHMLGRIIETAERHSVYLDEVLALLPDKSVSTGVVAGLVYAYPINPDRIRALCDQIRTGEMLKRGSPALAFRNWSGSNARRGIRPQNKENMIAGMAIAKAAIQGRELARIFAGIGLGTKPEGNTRTGTSTYGWVCSKRRVLGLAGTPSAKAVPLAPDKDKDEE